MGSLVVCWCVVLVAAARGERIDVAPDLYAPSGRSTRQIEQAEALYQQARQLCEAGDVGGTLRRVTEAVVADPEHAGARRVLGYRHLEGEWAGSYAARRLRRGERWYPEYGWIVPEDLPRYQAGERLLGKRWIPKQEDARRHQAIDNGWQVRTDHFQVLTNHSPAAAAALATRLEQEYQVWQQLFGGFYLEPGDLLKRFDGQPGSSYRSKPFQVRYYQTRDQYNQALLPEQPRIAMTLGIYFDTTRQSHFFAGAEQDAGTITHEAVHQFFQESQPAARRVGSASNAWLIEGVACYFESLTLVAGAEGEPYFTIGEPGAGRLPAARHRRLVDDFYVPLAELAALGVEGFQRRSDLPRLYSQSAGLVTFCMHAHQGRYRGALVKLLQELYAGRDRVSTLADLTGRSFQELDREYRQFLESLPAVSP